MFSDYKKNLSVRSVKLILITTLTSLIITILEFISPLLLKNFIDNYHIKNNIIKPLLIILVIYIFSYFFKIMLNKITNIYSVKFKTREHNQLLNYMFQMKYEKLISLEPTYLVEKITNSVNTLFSLYSESISSILISTMNIILSISLIIFIDKFVALILIIIIPLNIISYKILNKKLSDMCIDLQTKCAKSFMNIISITSQIDFIKQTAETTNIIKLINPYVSDIHKENAKVSSFARNISTTINDLINILHSGIYIYAAISLLTESILLSDFIFINLIISIFFPALNNIVKSNIDLRDLKGVYNFIEKEIFYNIEESGNLEINSIDEIEFNINKLGYQNLNLIETGYFKAKPGDIIMISGESGSGKTTLMKGLVKFINMDIKINGLSINKYKNSAVRNKILFFSQTVPIIAGTIKDNILMGDKSKEDILLKLCDKPFLKKFFEFNEGFETKVLENGSNLSGGDKQKIALARLFIDDPDVIILDEMTNSIDKSNASIIINDIINEYKNKIIFFISHDDYIKEYCNKVILIQDKTLQVANQ